MRKAILTSLAVCAAVSFGATVQHSAQQPAAAPAGPLMYGSPGITLEQAKKAVEAADRGSGKEQLAARDRGDVERRQSRALQQDGQHSVRLDRHRDSQGEGRGDLQASDQGVCGCDRGGPGNVALLTLDGIIASEGGIPITNAQGQIIGAIGCSGATGAAGRRRLHGRRQRAEVIARSGFKPLRRGCSSGGAFARQSRIHLMAVEVTSPSVSSTAAHTNAEVKFAIWKRP